MTQTGQLKPNNRVQTSGLFGSCNSYSQKESHHLFSERKSREGENGWHTGMTQTPSARMTRTSTPLAGSYLLEVLTIIMARYTKQIIQPHKPQSNRGHTMIRRSYPSNLIAARRFLHLKDRCWYNSTRMTQTGQLKPNISYMVYRITQTGHANPNT
jgi:hypothetical protein